MWNLWLFVLPLLPGKTDIDRRAMKSCWDGDRKSDFEAARTRVGITREAVFIQEPPMGTL